MTAKQGDYVYNDGYVSSRKVLSESTTSVLFPASGGVAF
jgi:hypothetical protein